MDSFTGDVDRTGLLFFTAVAETIQSVLKLYKTFHKTLSKNL